MDTFIEALAQGGPFAVMLGVFMWFQFRGQTAERKAANQRIDRLLDQNQQDKNDCREQIAQIVIAMQQVAHSVDKLAEGQTELRNDALERDQRIRTMYEMIESEYQERLSAAAERRIEQRVEEELAKRRA